MTVKELIEFLQKHPQDMPVAYRKFSENVLISKEDIAVVELCATREDGWVPNKRPDKPSCEYLLFPGN